MPALRISAFAVLTEIGRKKLAFYVGEPVFFCVPFRIRAFRGVYGHRKIAFQLARINVRVMKRAAAYLFQVGRQGDVFQTCANSKGYFSDCGHALRQDNFFITISARHRLLICGFLLMLGYCKHYIRICGCILRIIVISSSVCSFG